MLRLESRNLSSSAWSADRQVSEPNSNCISHNLIKFVEYFVDSLTKTNTLWQYLCCFMLYYMNQPGRRIKAINDDYGKYLPATNFDKSVTESNLDNRFTFVVGSNASDYILWFTGGFPMRLQLYMRKNGIQFDPMSENVNKLHRFSHLFYQNANFIISPWDERKQTLVSRSKSPHKRRTEKSILSLVIVHVDGKVIKCLANILCKPKYRENFSWKLMNEKLFATLLKPY